MVHNGVQPTPRLVSRRPQLADLTAAVRAAVESAGGERTAERVAAEIQPHLRSLGILDSDQRRGDPRHYRQHLLHAEPGGSFSVVALVWLPGQMTPIHDHLAWCVTGVMQGVEYEELFAVDDSGRGLVRRGTRSNQPGYVTGFAPPGDIHRVRNCGDETAISIHVFGTDISRVGSSVRRCYDLPVLTG
jgi:predicted metal-dependent enzyme (double-stranded beta helix superfamily)